MHSTPGGSTRALGSMRARAGAEPDSLHATNRLGDGGDRAVHGAT
jgi:hypothetical protein